MADTFRNQGFFDDKVLPAMRTADPHQAYVEFSARCPVAHNPDGTVTLTRYHDIQYVNHSREVLGNGHSGPGIVGARKKLIPLDLDGDEHRRWRKLLDPLFGPKRMSGLEPQIRERARHLLNDFADLGQADVFKSWCEPLPSSIFLSVLGLPQDDLPEFLDFMNSQLHPDPNKSREENLLRQKSGAERCYQYIDALITERPQADDPGDDFVNWLLTVKDDDGTRLSRDDVHAFMYLFLLAGLDTVASSLGNFLAYLARHADKRQVLLDRPEVWPTAVEELLRFEPAIPLGTRKNLVDLALPSGEVLKAGTVINVSWPAANLDPEIFENPLEVDFQRSPNPHVTFANGWHRCVGSHLARLEIRAALQEFHHRIPHYEIQPGVELVYSHDPRAPRTLPLVWSSR
jgi:cytochrome P450